MFKNKKTVLALTISAVVLFMSFVPTGYAATAQSTITAQFKALKILLNGSQVTMESQPIIVNGSTYLPLRAFANLFNKNVDWNADLQQVSITDKPDNELESLKAQLTEKENQIIILNSQLTSANKKIKDLEDEDEDEDEEDIDDIISDLEDDLNDKYDDKDFGEDYLDNEYIVFSDIFLDGDEDDIEIEIELDLEDFDDENYDWYDDIDEDDIIDLLQEICDEIWDDKDLEDADIEGTIYDTYNDDELESFSVKAGKDVDLD
ncbi:MAG: copper amine oxidase N-terminal domain-containing protein [Dehalobacterium sp.]